MRPSSLAACVLIFIAFAGTKCAAVRPELPGSKQVLQESGQVKCHKVKNATECDAAVNCVWCQTNQSWGTQCYAIESAKWLPAKWDVVCDKELNSSPPPLTPAEPEAPEPEVAEKQLVEAEPSAMCLKQKTDTDCDLLDKCVWCTKPGTKWGTGCYPISAARLLPAKWGVECDKDLDASPPPATPAEDPEDAPELLQQKTAQQVNSACIGREKPECTAECEWCSSALGDSCVNEAVAKLLPADTFTCAAVESADR